MSPNGPPPPPHTHTAELISTIAMRQFGEGAAVNHQSKNNSQNTDCGDLATSAERTPGGCRLCFSG